MMILQLISCSFFVEFFLDVIFFDELVIIAKIRLLRYLRGMEQGDSRGTETE